MRVCDRLRPASFSCQAIKDSLVKIVNAQVLEVLQAVPDGEKLLRLVVEDLAFQQAIACFPYIEIRIGSVISAS